MLVDRLLCFCWVFAGFLFNVVNPNCDCYVLMMVVNVCSSVLTFFSCGDRGTCCRLLLSDCLDWMRGVLVEVVFVLNLDVLFCRLFCNSSTPMLRLQQPHPR